MDLMGGVDSRRLAFTPPRGRGHRLYASSRQHSLTREVWC